MMDRSYTVGLCNDLYMDMGDNNEDGSKQEQIRKDAFLAPPVAKNKKKKVLVSDVKKKKKKPDEEDGDGEPSLKKVKKMSMNDVPLKPVGLSLSGSGMQLYVKADGPMMQRLSEDYEMVSVKPCYEPTKRTITTQTSQFKDAANDWFGPPSRDEMTDGWSANMSCNKRTDQGTTDRSFIHRLDTGLPDRRQADGHYLCSEDRDYPKGRDQTQDERTYAKAPYQGQGHRNIPRRPDQGHENKCYAEDYDSHDDMTCVKTPHQVQGHRNIARRPDQGHENKCYAEDYDSHDDMTCVKTPHQVQGHRTTVKRPDQGSVEKCYLEGSDLRHDDRSYSNRYDQHLARQKVPPRSQGSGSVPSTLNRVEWTEGSRPTLDDCDRFDVGMPQTPLYSHVNHTHRRSTIQSQTTPRDVPRNTNRVVDDRARANAGTSHVIADEDYRDLYEVNIPASPTNAHAHTSKERNNSYKTWASTSHAADPRDARSEPTPTTAEDSTLSSLSEFDLSRLPTEALDAVTLKKFAEYSKLMRRSMRQEYKQMSQLIKDFTEEMMERNKALLDENHSNNTDNNTEEEMKKESYCSIM